jgi:hypothetical protein
MANIITSKTRRRYQPNNNNRVSVSRPAFVKQKREVETSGGGNLSEYLYEKRIHELSNAGYGADAICGMMHGEKGSEKGDLGSVKEVIKRKGKTIKLDGNI